MVSDSTTTAFIPSAPNSANKNFSKKKRTNRSAKLKQCKSDARREQWLSQVAAKNKDCKDGGNYVQESLIPARKESKHSLENLELVRPRAVEEGGSIFHDSDLESLSNSPTSFGSSELSGNDSGTNFIGTSSSGSSSVGCCSGNVTGEEECDDDDDGCLDDWEAMADALAADDKHHNQCSQSPPHTPIAQMVSTCESSSQSVSGSRNWKSEGTKRFPRPARSNCRAWRPDDTCRPQSLPNLSKQLSLPNPEKRFGGGIPWACEPTTVTLSSCPICYEDLDLTESSFLPCLCGFRICLFCHKRILEEDGRCPGCRKPYEQHSTETEASVCGGSLMLGLARSRSMIERS